MNNRDEFLYVAGEKMAELLEDLDRRVTHLEKVLKTRIL